MNFKAVESNQKLNGSYYTPYWLADFLMRWVLSSSPQTILEPSCGDGVFFEAIPRTSKEIFIRGFDINEELVNCKSKLKQIPVQSEITARDFLQWAIENLTSDNAMAEKFFGILKSECINRQKIKDFATAKSLIDEYIHFYNHERIQLKTKLTPMGHRRQSA